jgi:4-hydroxybenzoate polyprenyltransferase
MTGFFRLIRLPNLLMVALTQYLMRYAVMEPLLGLSGVELQMSHFNFFLLSLSTVMIAAAGYIINDYFDLKIDRINRPDKVVVDISIKRRVAIGAHIVISLIGITLGFYVGLQVGLYKLAILHFISSGLLWYYSTDFKSQVLSGNIIIAFLAALVPLIVPLYEIPLLNQEYREILLETGQDFNFLLKFVGGFSLFAFLLTMAREIIKDIEDKKGDSTYGLKTLPIVFGAKKAKITAIIFIVATIVLLALIQNMQFMASDLISFIYILIAIEFPLFFLIFKLMKAQTQEDFHFASLFTKMIMLTGILYSVVVYFITKQIF